MPETEENILLFFRFREASGLPFTQKLTICLFPKQLTCSIRYDPQKNLPYKEHPQTQSEDGVGSNPI